MLPLFKYPTTTVWVDDDLSFLESMKLSYPVDLSDIFSSPIDCLKFLDSYERPLAGVTFLKSETKNESYNLPNRSPVNLDITDVAKLYNLKDKQQEISILICDYKMPEMSGLDLCRRSKTYPMKKILLTGEAKDIEVIEAFNNGIIDYFIRKDCQNFCHDIRIIINKLIYDYFCKQSTALLFHLEADHKLPLSDPDFISFFNDWCIYNKISEFYLIDKQGSFLVIRDGGKIGYFIVHTEQSLDDFVNIYSDCNVHNLMQLVISRKKIPYFGFNKEAWQFEYKEWGKYFYDSNVIHGREKYYWVVI